MPKLTQKGQVTIPQKIRTLLNIKTGDDILFDIIEGNVVINKKPASPKNILNYVEDTLFEASRAWKSYLRRKKGLLVCPACGKKKELYCQSCNQSIPHRQYILSDFLIGAHRPATHAIATRIFRQPASSFPAALLHPLIERRH